MVTTVSFIRGAAFVGKGAVFGGSCFTVSQVEQLLARDKVGVDVAVALLRRGPDVEVKEPVEAAEVKEAWDVGPLPRKMKVGLGPADIGLIIVGDMVFRKSR
jgi:hypothetical protein